MTARDAAAAALDATVDAIATDASTAVELFAVVDLLDDQPMLRRSLSDPSASDEARAALARRLFGAKVSASTIDVLVAIVETGWRSGNAMVTGLERQGIRLALRKALAAGELDRVVSELYQLSVSVDQSPDLAVALRSRAYPIEGKRELIKRLIQAKVSPTTETLAERAVNARRRTFSLTIAEYLKMAAEVAGSRIARVSVARPLDEGRVARLKAALERQTGGPVTLQIAVNPAVIGGMSVAIDDDVFESTVAARLEDARRQLINS